MKNSPFRQLQSAGALILSAGHGGADPGACNDRQKERDQCILIVDAMAGILNEHSCVDVMVTPHKLDTHEAIWWVNRYYPNFGTAWAVEVHRDSADTITEPAASLRCGVYHGASGGSGDVARGMLSVLKEHGAHGSSWAREHTESGHGSLMWITRCKPLSHLLELGFMEGANDEAHLRRLARMGAAALLWAFAGIKMPKA
jgi:N-acetylmuramoyl-L-alanine amidase